MITRSIIAAKRLDFDGFVIRAICSESLLVAAAFACVVSALLCGFSVTDSHPEMEADIAPRHGLHAKA